MRDIVEKLGFDYRKSQARLIDEILRAYKDVDDVIVEAPTGWGKSLIAAVLAEIYEDAYLSSAEKILQKQYLDDFPYFINLIGKANYNCFIDKKLTVEDAPCTIFPNLECKKQCQYYINKSKAKKEKTKVVTNHHLLAVEFDFVHSLPQKEIAIYDEAHVLEDLLTSYGSVRLNTQLVQFFEALSKNIIFEDLKIEISQLAKKLKAFLALGKNTPEERILPMIEEGYKSIFRCRKKIESKIRKRIGSLNPKMLQQIAATNDGKKFLKALTILQIIDRFCCKWSNYLDFKKHNVWVEDATNEELSLTPISVSFYTSRILKAAGKKRLYMSATIGDVETYAQNLGIKNYKAILLSSKFKKEKRKIIFEPYAKINYEFTTSSRLNEYIKFIANKTEEFLEKHGNGIIFAGTYKIADLLAKELNKRSIKYWRHKDSQSREETIENFKRFGGVLISASIFQGVDLKGDYSRFQIIVKIPFQSLASKFVRTKAKINPDWYASNAALKIAQAYGRSIRSEDDYAATYVYDASFKQIIRYLPKYVKEAILMSSR